MTTTNALSAGPEATAEETSSTDIALSAISTRPTEIKPWIEECLRTVQSDDFSTLKSTSEAAARHGFSKSANSRLVGFLEAFRSNPHLTKRYAEEYPNCVFLPWPAFHQILGALDCWCDLPEHYVGAVPESQIPWMDCFDLQEQDAPAGSDFIHGLMQEGEVFSWNTTPREDLLSALWNGRHHAVNPAAMKRVTPVLNGIHAFLNDFFVVAPPEAFETQEDFISRMNRLTEVALRETVPPDDPLVIRFCHGGALVVAAWGEEAAEMNALVRQLNL